MQPNKYKSHILLRHRLLLISWKAQAQPAVTGILPLTACYETAKIRNYSQFIDKYQSNCQGC